jgi:hypothetical protein
MKPASHVLQTAAFLFLAGWVVDGVHAQSTVAENLVFNTIEPCRVLDTRHAAAGALLPEEIRTLHVVGFADLRSQGGSSATGCGIPGFLKGRPLAQAVLMNFSVMPTEDPEQTAVQASTEGGELSAWPSDSPRPRASLLAFPGKASGFDVANGMAVALRQDMEGDDLSVSASREVNVVATVLGYYSTLPPRGGEAGVDAASTRVDGTFDNLTVNGNLTLPASASKTITGSQGNLTFQETGDTFGAVKMSLQNRVGVNGVLFEQSSVGALVDFALKAGTSQRNLRLEGRNGLTFAGSPEFQIGVAGNPTLAVSDTLSVFRRGSVCIGTTTANGALHVVAGSTGIYAESTNTSGSPEALRGDSAGATGFGVFGLAKAASGHNDGVYGRSSSPDGHGGHFETGGQGVALYAVGNGPGRDHVTLRVINYGGPGTHSIAAYVTNNSDYATAHFANASNGQVLFLQNGGTDADGAGGGDFIDARNSPESDIQFRVLTTGEVRSDVGFNTPAADFAEMLPAVEGLTPGDVLVIGADGKLTRSTQPGQANVVGVYSTSPGFVGGKPVEGSVSGTIPLAIVGIVPVKVSAENGAIQPGDRLVASATPGYAMKVVSRPEPGTIVGKALGTLRSGTGVIQVVVTLQ